MKAVFMASKQVTLLMIKEVVVAVIIGILSTDAGSKFRHEKVGLVLMERVKLLSIQVVMLLIEKVRLAINKGIFYFDRGSNLGITAGRSWLN